MSERCTIYLIRHGATAHNEARPIVLQGSGVDGPLSETGRKQAEVCARFLAGHSFAAIYSSPMLRARQTAEEIAAPHQLTVNTLEHIQEVHVGRWERKPWTTIMEEEPDEYRHYMDDPATNAYPGGESFVDVLDRVKPVITKVAQQHLAESIAIVAHNVVNRVMLADAIGLPLKLARRIRQTNTGINVLKYADVQFEVMTVNGVFHLDGME